MKFKPAFAGTITGYVSSIITLICFFFGFASFDKLPLWGKILILIALIIAGLYTIYEIKKDEKKRKEYEKKIKEDEKKLHIEMQSLKSQKQFLYLSMDTKPQILLLIFKN